MLIKDRCDVALYFIAGNSPFAFLPRLIGIPTALNVDGLDSQRDKWGKAARKYIRFAEWLAPLAAAAIVSDSQVVQRYYMERFQAESTFIPYGGQMDPAPGTQWLDKFGLEPRKYILFVGRLVAENRPHILIEAFSELKTELKLVLVGDASYSQDYINQLKEAASNKNIIFTGYVFGEGYRQLSQNAYIFVEPTIVGGTHPVIVEALTAGNCVVVSNYPPNMEVIGDAGVSFDSSQGSPALRRVLQELIDDPTLVAAYREKASKWAKSKYDWETITNQYEELCLKLLNRN